MTKKQTALLLASISVLLMIFDGLIIKLIALILMAVSAIMLKKS